MKVLDTYNQMRLGLHWTLLLALSGLASVTHAQLPDFTRLAEEMSPTVVSISAFHSDASGRERVSYGSGFIYTKDGYIITNHHVTNGAQSLQVRFNDRLELLAQQVGADELTDVALLKVDARKLSLEAVKIGKSEALRVGQWVAAIGSPFGFDYTLTAGVVSALGRSLPNETYVPFIQSDVAVNEGNSGGPLFDLQGNVVGINSRIFTQTGSFAGLSFSIPMHIAVSVVEQLRTKGRVTRGWLGISIRNVPRQLVEPFGLDRAYGALVVEVLKDGPAINSSIRNGDVIVEFNGNAIINSGDLPVFVGQTPPGTRAKIKLIREGEPTTVSVTLGEKTGDEIVIGVAGKESNRLGLVLRNLSHQDAAALGIAGGVIVREVKNGSLAGKAGLVSGDVITHFYQTPIHNIREFNQQLRKYPGGSSVPIRLIRNQRIPLFVALIIP